jgi:hypothetical protein
MCRFLDPLLVLSYSSAPTFPTMNPRELVENIRRGGPAELVLHKPLRFRHEHVPTSAISVRLFKPFNRARRFEA